MTRRNIGSILTVCKGIDRADDIKLNQDSKLMLVPEPTNKYDQNAVRVCLALESPESLDAVGFCGYLPKKLVHHIAKYFSDPSIQIECVLLPPSGDKKTGLTCMHSVWASFDVQLNFWGHVAPTQSSILAPCLGSTVGTGTSIVIGAGDQVKTGGGDTPPVRPTFEEFESSGLSSLGGRDEQKSRAESSDSGSKSGGFETASLESLIRFINEDATNRI